MCACPHTYKWMMVHSVRISSPHNKKIIVKLKSQILYTKFFCLQEASSLSVPLLGYCQSKAHLLSINLSLEIQPVYILYLSQTMLERLLELF